MPHPRISGDEINRRGKEWYEQTIRPIVETEENIGKIISIDVETGDYAIADDPITAGDMIFARHPDAAMYGMRIGYNAMYAIGDSDPDGQNMNGYVSGRQPRIGVVFLLPNQQRIEIEFVIDTGFEGALTLPAQAVAALNLPLYQNIDAYLADDSSRKVDLHTATILWQGKTLNVAVLAMGQRPLLGTALLDGNDLHIHFDDGGPLSVTSF